MSFSLKVEFINRIFALSDNPSHRVLTVLGFRFKIRKKNKLYFRLFDFLAKEKLIIDEEYCKDLAKRFILDYEIVQIPLSMIVSKIKGNVVSLDELEAYKYLLGDRDSYLFYLKHLDGKIKNHLYSEEKYKKLINHLDSEGFNPKNLIVIDYNFHLLDGQHRACYLLHKFGSDYKVNVLKLKYV